MDFADIADDPFLNFLFHALKLGKVLLLVADYGLDAVLMAEIDHLFCLLKGLGHRLFQGNGLYAVFDGQLNHAKAQVWIGDEDEYIWPGGF